MRGSRFEAELETSRINLEGLRLRVANYHQWEDLNKERRALVEDLLEGMHRRMRGLHQGRRRRQTAH